MPATRKLVKMLGTVGWCGVGETYEGEIRRAILRNDETLALDLVCGLSTYSVTLTRKIGDQFDGDWTRYAGTMLTGTASSTLYRSSSDRLLFGEWIEENTRYRWWAELREVATFPDEESEA
jgi:hypothetical protein